MYGGLKCEARHPAPLVKSSKREIVMLIVDRPWPINHEYKSVKFIVGFSWGSPESEIPISGYFEIETDSGEFLKIIEPSLPWGSQESAEKDVIAQAEKFIDAGLIDFPAANQCL
jgi:hypothetical protein